MISQDVRNALEVAAILGTAMWTLINLRIENRILRHIDDLKEWVDSRYERKPEAAPYRRRKHAVID